MFFLQENQLFSCAPIFRNNNTLASAERTVNTFGFKMNTAKHYRHSYQDPLTCCVYFANTIWSHEEIYCQQKQPNVHAFCQKNLLAALCQQTVWQLDLLMQKSPWIATVFQTLCQIPVLNGWINILQPTRWHWLSSLLFLVTSKY